MRSIPSIVGLLILLAVSAACVSKPLPDDPDPQEEQTQTTPVEPTPQDGPAKDERKCLTFTTEGSASLSLNNWGNNTPVLFFSNDGKTWVEWDYTALSFNRKQSGWVQQGPIMFQ